MSNLDLTKCEKVKTEYHCEDSCNKCGMDFSNELFDTSYEGSVLLEANTKCKECDHEDYWAYGFFESSQDGLNACVKYTVGN